MLSEGLESLVAESVLYTDQLKSESPIKIGFKLTDTGEESSIRVHEQLTVLPNTSEAVCLITMKSSTFKSILEGEADFAALIGRSRMSDRRPINLKVHDQARFDEVFETVKALMTVFFLPGRIKSKKLSREFAGSAHGAHPIPLVYWERLRYAWYHVSSGEVLNIEGEKDPYPQAILALKGEGKLELDAFPMDMELNRIYYIPPNSIHRVHAITDIELIWMAWNTTK
ncbi:hypothetical protein GF319_11580 [Candidatus Bathyarchaeota archaeon]|nr:hypothetical protein [Candidatus Bathyarchaeota archaeon]